MQSGVHAFKHEHCMFAAADEVPAVLQMRTIQVIQLYPESEVC